MYWEGPVLPRWVQNMAFPFTEGGGESAKSQLCLFPCELSLAVGR